MKRFGSKLAIAIMGLLLTAWPAHASDGDQSGARARPGSSSGDEQTATPRTATAGSPAGDGDRATPRHESGSAGAPAVSRSTGADRDSTASRRASDMSNNVSGANVPTGTRPRGNRPATDVAVPRVGPRPPRDSGDRNRRRVDTLCASYIGCGDFYPSVYLYGFPLYLYGIPYEFVDPYPSDLLPGDPRSGAQDRGTLKLKLKPRNAKVYVDGYYVGLVDEFDGVFQKLTLNGGRHKVEIRAEGYETTELDVLITPERSVTLEGHMKKVQ